EGLYRRNKGPLPAHSRTMTPKASLSSSWMTHVAAGVPRPASVDQVAAHAAGFLGVALWSRRGTAITEGVVTVRSPPAKGGLYGSCPGLRFVQASHLVAPSGEAHRPRLATYWGLPEARTTSRHAESRRSAGAGGCRAA